MKRSNVITFKVVVGNVPNVLVDADYYTNIDVENDPVVTNKFALILNIIQTVGVIASVITLMIIGIKYLFGSIEQKAEYKQTLLPWLVGAILVFVASAIPKMISQIVINW